MTAANTFSLFNSGRLAVGLSIEMDAPTGATLNMPPQLPDILVNASATPYSPFSLTLTPRTGMVNNPVQILAAPPQIAGKNTWPEKSFVPIGSLSFLRVFVVSGSRPQRHHPVVCREVRRAERRGGNLPASGGSIASRPASRRAAGDGLLHGRFCGANRHQRQRGRGSSASRVA